ncbi:MAG: hypothetical protein AAFR31_20650 [Cyanobacteria bacterium J06627_8]
MTCLNLKTLPSAQERIDVMNSQIQEIGDTGASLRRITISREAFVSWLFLLGSLMFVLDSILENMRGVSFSSLLHLVASILFTIGSVLFIPNDSQR